MSEAKSAEYFDSRPVGSRIGAAVSVRQSEVVASREVLTVSNSQIYWAQNYYLLWVA